MHMSELEAQIRQRAYAIWEQSGRPEGQERQHWEQAARETLSAGRADVAKETAGAAKRSPAKSPSAKGRGRKLAA